MNLYPDRLKLLARLGSRFDSLATEFNGSVFRFVGPQHSSTTDLFAGKGSLFANGRWLLKGKLLATYTALEPETALGESLAAIRYFNLGDENSEPIVLVTASTKLSRVIDLTDGKVRQRLRIAEKVILNCNWRKENFAGEEALTQAWGWAFAEAGAEGFLVPSAACSKGTNLIIFPENFTKKSRLKVMKEVEWPPS